MPEYTGDITALGTTRLLDAIGGVGLKQNFIRLLHLRCLVLPHRLKMKKLLSSPRSPYAAAKVYAYWMGVNYREGYKMFACNGILFNHESPRRGETFLTRKVTMAVANILAGKQKKLYLGNLEAKRDWGFAPEYVEAMWLMLQQKEPDDFAVGTGESHPVREFVDKAFRYAGIELKWKGKGYK